MPRYDYQCTHCQVQETRIAGLDDHLAICQYCGQLMLRLDLDLFGPYFDQTAAGQAGPPEAMFAQTAGQRPAGK